jgi:hypothetical protein
MCSAWVSQQRWHFEPFASFVAWTSPVSDFWIGFCELEEGHYFLSLIEAINLRKSSLLDSDDRQLFQQRFYCF